MAKRTVLVDDLDGDDFQGVTTHTFSLDADRYHIDLSPKNLMLLKGALEPFVSVARHAAKRRPRTSSRRAPSTSALLGRTHREELNRQERQAIRAWAEENGMEVAARGAFPKDVIAAYWEAHGNIPTAPS
jgi:hypothetical protein